MFRVTLFLGILLACTALSSQAQTSQTPTQSTAVQKELTVQVTLPTVVGLIGEYVGILNSREKGKIKALTEKGRSRSTSNPVLTLNIPLPRIWADPKPKPK